MATSRRSGGRSGSQHRARALHGILNDLDLHSESASEDESVELESPSATLVDAGVPDLGVQEQASFSAQERALYDHASPRISSPHSTHLPQMTSSPPAASGQPLTVLTSASPASGSSRRTPIPRNDAAVSSASTSTSVPGPRAEKDTDDPSTPIEVRDPLERLANHPQIALTRLFAASDGTPASASRQPSYTTPSATEYTRAPSSDIATLPQHLYTRGLLSGKHSDIAVYAFSTRYALHRIIIDRAPFFTSALSEPWFESSSKEITLHPEDIDSNITQPAFELALKRLYGCHDSAEEDTEAVGLFATGCWLEMTDLIDASVESILRQMAPSKLSRLIKLVTRNYYGKHGERILASAKAMLCRDGWEMPVRHWDGVSGDIAREIVGGDGFFVPGEWERWHLAKKILDRRLKGLARDAGLLNTDGTPARAPDSLGLMSFRFDSVYRRNSISGGRPTSEGSDSWIALYSHPDITPLLVLLDEGIHYVHLSFEQLQHIRMQRDILGLPVLPERVLSNALWMSMELRQRVMNARDTDLELGLKKSADEGSEDGSIVSPVATNGLPSTSSSKGKRTQVPVAEDAEEDQPESGSWDGNGKPRKFWIPNVDCTCFMGGFPEAAHNSTTPRAAPGSSHGSRLSASFQPQDVQWASDFTLLSADRPMSPPEGPAAANVTPPAYYTHVPPFRFSAEFPNPRLLKEKKRVYSRTVWYAGSMWNLYIQKVRSTKNVQLGVYLHRAKEKDEVDAVAAAAMYGSRGTVDERIGQLEREMLLRRNERRARRQMDMTGDGEEDTSGSGGEPDILGLGSSVRPGVHPTLSTLLRNDGTRRPSPLPQTLSTDLPDRDAKDDERLDLVEDGTVKTSPTLPGYHDARPTIRTYFKIYSPSKGGRMLSVYESAPDKFNFSQSWGWKSSAMVLDDGPTGYEEGTQAKHKEGRLRFMVVIGKSRHSLKGMMARLFFFY
ncbi:hypothetical protein L228DRAFT_248957 [Xylona heveae TC161]|uniref:BTB domain-containing protein n=1 Tax=Xylona heveae (strain CBS 132557 / TC161) TaxID=1328760 RepID=A0A165FN46_XYLHT|nr:hypothetical protein L228DRAFT_248957 [Xylona heveae TC161]KZF21180.1 hypothetical protein L228DRAFT_248957 [Xylona heveae TC161]